MAACSKILSNICDKGKKKTFNKHKHFYIFSQHFMSWLVGRMLRVVCWGNGLNVETPSEGIVCTSYPPGVVTTASEQQSNHASSSGRNIINC